MTTPTTEQAARECAERCATAIFVEGTADNLTAVKSLTPIILEAMRKVSRHDDWQHGPHTSPSPATTSVPTEETEQKVDGRWWLTGKTADLPTDGPRRTVPTNMIGQRKLPTIDELQAILDDPTPRTITVNPDTLRKENAELKAKFEGALSASGSWAGECDALREQVRVLREAGKVFANIAIKWDGKTEVVKSPTDSVEAWKTSSTQITLGDCRVMRQALSATEPATRWQRRDQP